MWERRRNKVSMVTALERWKIEEWFFVKKKRGGKKRQGVGEWKANMKKKKKDDIRKEADDMKLKEKLIKLATSGKGNEQ